MKVFLILIAVLAGKSLEIFAFSMSVTALRQRLGGWHAKNAWSCQIVSVFSALFAVFVIGPHMEKLAIWIIILFDIIIFLFGLVLKPVYPPQLHFLDDVIEANNQKKRQVLYIILIAQILSLIFYDRTVMVYSALGISAALSALIAEWFIQQRRN